MWKEDLNNRMYKIYEICSFRHGIHKNNNANNA